MTPVLHVSQRYPATRLCAAAVLPLTRHPRIDSRVIVFDLDGDIEPLLTLSADDIADRLYTPAKDLPEGEQRIGLKEVHTNKVPALVAWNHLRAADLARLQLDRDSIEAKAARLRELGPQLAEKVRRIYAGSRDNAPADVDASLYEGFLAEGDRRLFPQLRNSAPAELAGLETRLRDHRMPELLFRYRARNWPQTLSADEQERWDDYRRGRLCEDSGLSELTFEQFHTQIAELRLACSEDRRALDLLDHLSAWGNDLHSTL
jgi:exodeoxyribonuclease-1